MNNIVNRLGPLCPPIRFIISSNCNGACYFCHNEGNPSKSNMIMSLSTLEAAASAARIIGINKITISGGEPSLIDDLPVKLCAIKKAHPSSQLSIVTNGFDIVNKLQSIRSYLHNIDLSVVSFTSYNSFTGLSPHHISSVIENICRHNIPLNINTIVIEENANDILNIIRLAIRKNVSITLMMPRTSMSSSRLVALLDKIIKSYQIEDISVRNVPVLEKMVTNRTRIRIKLPELSGMIQWPQCSTCEKRHLCTEFFCAIRVSPDGDIYNCISSGQTVGNANTVNDFVHYYNIALQQMVGKIHSVEDLLYLPTKQRRLLAVN